MKSFLNILTAFSRLLSEQTKYQFLKLKCAILISFPLGLRNINSKIEKRMDEARKTFAFSRAINKIVEHTIVSKNNDKLETVPISFAKSCEILKI